MTRKTLSATVGLFLQLHHKICCNFTHAFGFLLCFGWMQDEDHAVRRLECARAMPCSRVVTVKETLGSIHFSICFGLKAIGSLITVSTLRYLGDCGYTANNTVDCPVDPLDGTCSGHGKCNAVTDQCECYDDYSGFSCQLRSCPFGVAWFDEATDADTVRGCCLSKDEACQCIKSFHSISRPTRVRNVRIGVPAIELPELAAATAGLKEPYVAMMYCWWHHFVQSVMRHYVSCVLL